MPSFRDFVQGPWRAIPVLGVTQLIAWGTIFYTPVLMVPLIAAERGFSATYTMAGFSAGLLASGAVAPAVGRLIDRHGGHRVMPFGSLLGAAGLVGLVHVTDPLLYMGVWLLLGIAMSASLYDPAFATLGRIFGAAARPPIAALTLIGGFASTLSWPATHLLVGSVGWRSTYLLYAALLAFAAAPLHAFALPRGRATADIRPAGAPPPPAVAPASGATFLLVAVAFASYAFVPSTLSAHMLAIFQRQGLDPATVVLVGTLFGPAQVAARLCELVFARNVHPIWIARLAIGMLVAAFAVVLTVGLSPATAIAFTVVYGLANGLHTIVRGTVPLALFGASGFGALIGRIARPALIVTALAPVAVAFVAERASDSAALALAGAFCAFALACLVSIRRPAAKP